MQRYRSWCDGTFQALFSDINNWACAASTGQSEPRTPNLEHRVTSMVVVPQVLDLFWSAIEREVEKSGRTKVFDRLRSIARRLPMSVRRVIFRRV